ncbi:MAG: sterol desaturase/sphingolipid hydroxylase (fatty acid hydroxylase superfamily), partial [Flavobacterium sp.]
YVLVTPDMHKFHHHFEAPWTDSNFGNVFSIWDRIFGTLVYEDVEIVQYGLDVVDSEQYQNLAYQYILPFTAAVSRTNSAKAAQAVES